MAKLSTLAPLFLVPVLVGAAAWATGCGSNNNNGFGTTDGGDLDGSVDGFDPFAQPDGQQQNTTLDIKPPNPTLAYPSQQQQHILLPKHWEDEGIDSIGSIFGLIKFLRNLINQSL